jgi:hypothetical protein
VLKVNGEESYNTGRSYVVSLDSEEGKIEYKNPAVTFTSGNWFVVLVESQSRVIVPLLAE